MKILVTGSNGFVGKNFVWNLKNIRDGKNQTRPGLNITEIYEYDITSTFEELQNACKNADFVFNFAGVNRPKENSEFMKGNFAFASTLLNMLKENANTCPVMLSSSTKASFAGRFTDSEYGRSKLASEELFFKYGEETGARVLVYRFPNVFGKWCKANYNSAVATFCNAVANDLEYTVNDRAIKLELLYIDDLVNEMLDALEGKEHRCNYPNDNAHRELKTVEVLNGKYCFVPSTYHITLGEIVDLLEVFKDVPETLIIPYIPKGSFAKKLYSTYLSYLPESAVAFNLDMKLDNRGIFTELIKLESHGQVSVNVVRPGVTRGQHWHNSKCEIFIVVSGHGLIQERKIGSDPETGKKYPMMEFEVKGEQMRAVQMLPGYVHNITNLSESENLVMIIWANEQFDKNDPDTFFESI